MLTFLKAFDVNFHIVLGKGCADVMILFFCCNGYLNSFSVQVDHRLFQESIFF